MIPDAFGDDSRFCIRTCVDVIYLDQPSLGFFQTQPWGYTDGVQVWDFTDPVAGRELVSKQDKAVLQAGEISRHALISLQCLS